MYFDVLKNFAVPYARKLENIEGTTQSLYNNQRVLSAQDLQRQQKNLKIMLGWQNMRKKFVIWKTS